MAEAAETAAVVETATAVAETAAVETVVETHDDPDTEPGGSTPQEIRARKEYRLRKRLENELFDLQQERAATNARLKTLEEVTKPQPPKAREYTNAELQAAVDAGTITNIDAADYLAERRARQTADRVVTQERKRDAEATRQGMAQAQIDKYVEVAPWLNDKRDDRRKPLEVEYARLIDPNGVYRLSDSTVTEALLLEKVFGNVETFKAKAKLSTASRAAVDSHVESGGGGTVVPVKQAGSVDISKLPKHVQEYVAKSGMNQKDSESYAKFYVERRGQTK